MLSGYGLAGGDFIRQTLHVRAFRCAVGQDSGDPLRKRREELTIVAR
jgi:hypothetical protein